METLDTVCLFFAVAIVAYAAICIGMHFEGWYGGGK